MAKKITPSQRRKIITSKKIGKRLRLSVYKSNKHIYGQIIDDERGITLASASDLGLKKKNKTKSEAAFEVGKTLASRALKAGIKEVRFDRGKFPYKGRIKILAGGAREGGLKF